jgi:nucleoside 2-deoxyribosyltransferase
MTKNIISTLKDKKPFLYFRRHIPFTYLILSLFIFCTFPAYTLFASSKKTTKVFFAGDLFNHKDLIGNIYLADAIKNISNGKYELFLAQNKVQQKVHHKEIKDQDLKGLIESDIALFCFDGTELDSGTVVEFMSAKFLDKPSVVYRTDFRGGSGEEESLDDQNIRQGNKWNLMVSFYPRTKVLYLNAMVEYQKVFNDEKNDKNYRLISQQYANNIARYIIRDMEQVMNEKPLIKDHERAVSNKKFRKLMGIDE